MQEIFFTSKQAAEITSCTLRQLQYWREKGVVIPTISGTGMGRSVYYSRSELVEERSDGVLPWSRLEL